MYGEERIPTGNGVGESEEIQLDLGPAQTVVVLEPALPFPQHDHQAAAQGVARLVLERLLELGLARVLDHPGLLLLQPPVPVPKVALYVRVRLGLPGRVDVAGANYVYF